MTTTKPPIDRIVYIVCVKPGGIDGMDMSATGGPKYASFDKEDASKHLDPWSELRSEIVEDVENQHLRILKKLHPIDALLLREHFLRNAVRKR